MRPSLFPKRRRRTAKLDQFAEASGAAPLAEFAQRRRLDLPDALPRDFQFPARPLRACAVSLPSRPLAQFDDLFSRGVSSSRATSSSFAQRASRRFHNRVVRVERRIRSARRLSPSSPMGVSSDSGSMAPRSSSPSFSSENGHRFGQLGAGRHPPNRSRSVPRVLLILPSVSVT